eukprot:m.157720 g.157720  ORF g.157720 m.157720 type:complete len:92 (-) comp14480_c0_seq1:1468-1743(-)
MMRLHQPQDKQLVSKESHNWYAVVYVQSGQSLLHVSGLHAQSWTCLEGIPVELPEYQLLKASLGYNDVLFSTILHLVGQYQRAIGCSFSTL